MIDYGAASAGALFDSVSDVINRLPSRGGVERFINSLCVGSLSHAKRRATSIVETSSSIERSHATYLPGLVLHELAHLRFRIILVQLVR